MSGIKRNLGIFIVFVIALVIVGFLASSVVNTIFPPKYASYDDEVTAVVVAAVIITRWFPTGTHYPELIPVPIMTIMSMVTITKSMTILNPRVMTRTDFC